MACYGSGFFPTSHKREIPGRIGNSGEQFASIRLTSLLDIFQSTEGGTIPGQVVLGFVRKVTEYELERKLVPTIP